MKDLVERIISIKAEIKELKYIIKSKRKRMYWRNWRS